MPTPSPRLTSRSFGFVPWLANLVMTLLALTWRFELVAGGESFERVLAERRPVVWCLWHNRIAAGAGLLFRRVAPSGMDLGLVTSASRDGAISAAMVAARGGRVFRGSSSRGGARVLREVIVAMRKHRTSPILVPDGPRGPAYRMKPGVLALAAKTGHPIVGVGLAARRAWIFGTWDRLIVPKPFTLIAAAVAEPREVPARMSEEEADQQLRDFEADLDGLCRIAEQAVGATDPFADAEGPELSAGG